MATDDILVAIVFTEFEGKNLTAHALRCKYNVITLNVRLIYINSDNGV